MTSRRHDALRPSDTRLAAAPDDNYLVGLALLQPYFCVTRTTSLCK